MKKLSFIFALLLSVMGVNAQGFTISGTDIFHSSDWSYDSDRWSDYAPGMYDNYTSDPKTETALISPLMTMTKADQQISVKGYRGGYYNSKLKFYYSYDKENWIAVGDKSSALENTDYPTIGTFTSDLFEVTGNYYVKLSITGMYLTEFSITESCYTVAGEFNGEAGFFGAYWDEKATANQMELTSDGTFKKVYENVEFTTTGTITYKVVKNNDWNTASYPSSNATCAINAVGKYNITFTFNPQNNSVNCEAEQILNEYTVTFTDNAAWGNVAAYVWSGEGNDATNKVLGEWPGTVLTEKEGNVYTLTLKAAEMPENIIFNNNDNGRQTEDLAFEDGKAYNNGTLNNYTATVKFIKDAWENVYAYAWNGEKYSYLSAWPGTQLAANADGTYTVAFEATEAPTNIQFNDGTDAKKEEFTFTDGQTYEIEYTAPKEYGIDVTFGSSFALPNGWYYEKESETLTNTGWATYSNAGSYMAYAPQYWANTKDNDVTIWETPAIGVSGTDDALAISCYKWAPSSYNSAFDDSDVVLKVMYSTDKENWTTAASYDNKSFAAAYQMETKTISGIPAGNYFFRFEINNIAFDYLKGFSKATDNEYTVRVKNNAGWDKVYAYTWTKDDYITTEFTGAFPGTEMTQDGDVYTLTFSAPMAPVMILFDNGNNGKQTADLVWEDGKVYENAVVLALDETATENAVVAGTYDKVTVNFTMTGDFASICLPFAVSDVTAFGDGAKVWEFSGYDGNVNLSKVDAMEAGKPYVLYAPNLGTLEFSNVTIESAEPVAVAQGEAQFLGSYVKMAAGTLNGKYGVTPAGKIQKAGASASSKAFRAFFTLPAGSDGAKLVFDGEATGIESLSAAEQDGEMFDLQGRRVSRAQKGIYIQNGKKFVVK